MKSQIMEATQYWNDKEETHYTLGGSPVNVMEKDEFMEFADMMQKKLVEAYKLGYSDRTHKMSPFNNQEPAEYILSYLKRM